MAVLDQTQLVFALIYNIISSRINNKTGQLQILSVIAFLFLIPTAIIVAQNATLVNNSLELTGNMINGSVDTVNLNITEQIRIQNLKKIENKTGESKTEKNENEEGVIELNETQQKEGNLTISKNITKENNLTKENPINETISENKTEVINETVVDEPIEYTELVVETLIEERVIRGESFEFEVIIENVGNGKAENIETTLDLPVGFSVTESDMKCISLESEQRCVHSFEIMTDLTADIGTEKIGVMVMYE